jgi:beta-lactam-binding protein with PASTA domain
VVEQATSDPTQDGRVTSQNPAGGVKAVPGSTVTIYVGKLSASTTPARAPGPGVGPARRAA